jgi:putative Mg2+ transporter-C (MgtC) family protein
MDLNPQLQILLETLIAAILGGLIGYERELRNKPAGLRTYILVAASSCLLVNLGSMVIGNYQSDGQDELIMADPVRIIQAIILGIAFIGSGIIQRNEKGEVENLTTAALVLFTAIIGITVGLQQYILAASLTLASLLIAYVLKLVEDKLAGNS